MHQNKWFQVRFFKIFWGGAHRASSPDPFPRFYSGFALDSGFALNSQALRAFDLDFALDSRALRALDLGFALNFRMENLVWPPQNKFLDLPLREASAEKSGKSSYTIICTNLKLT